METIPLTLITSCQISDGTVGDNTKYLDEFQPAQISDPATGPEEQETEYPDQPRPDPSLSNSPGNIVLRDMEELLAQVAVVQREIA